MDKFNAVMDKARAEIEKQYSKNTNADILAGLVAGYSYYTNKLTKLQKTKPIEEQLVIVGKKIAKAKANDLQAIQDYYADLAKYEAIPADYRIKIAVEWKKSATWGSNPNAECWESHTFNYATAKASGCGYDKLSTVTASCLNNCKYVLAELTRQYNAALLENPNSSIWQVFPYGVAMYYDRIQFSGGVGVNCHIEILKTIGLNVQHISGKTFDTLAITKEGNNNE